MEKGRNFWPQRIKIKNGIYNSMRILQYVSGTPNMVNIITH